MKTEAKITALEAEYEELEITVASGGNLPPLKRDLKVKRMEKIRKAIEHYLFPPVHKMPKHKTYAFNEMLERFEGALSRASGKEYLIEPGPDAKEKPTVDALSDKDDVRALQLKQRKIIVEAEREKRKRWKN